jgi:hypothetical protein
MVYGVLMLTVGFLVQGFVSVGPVSATAVPETLYCRNERSFDFSHTYAPLRVTAKDCMDSTYSPYGVPPMFRGDNALCWESPSDFPGVTLLDCYAFDVEDLRTAWGGQLCVADAERWGDVRRGVFGSNEFLCVDATQAYYAIYGRR